MSIRHRHRPNPESLLMDIAFDGLEGSNVQQVVAYSDNAGFGLISSDSGTILRFLHSSSSIGFFLVSSSEKADSPFVSDGEVRGYCPSYERRRRLYDLDEILKTSPDRLSIVLIDQKLREQLLTSRWVSGTCLFKDQTYGILEYIARSRFGGVLVAGNEDGSLGIDSLRRLTNLGSKSLFYLVEQLETNRVVSKQDCVFKYRSQSKVVVHVRFRPKYDDYLDCPGETNEIRPTDLRRAKGVTLEADLVGILVSSLERTPDKKMSLQSCKMLLGISRRVLRRLLSKCVSRGDVQRLVVGAKKRQPQKRAYIIRLVSSGRKTFENDLKAREQKRSHLGR